MKLIDANAAKAELLRMVGDIHGWGEFFDGIRSGYQSADDEAYYRNGYCTKCKAQMPTEVLHGKISQRSIRFCFNCGAKINGVLWTLIEEGIIKEK